MAGPEAIIERKTCKIVEDKYGVRNIKIKVRGWPDRMFLIPGGKPLFVEFKAPGEEPRKLQEHIHVILRRLGYEVKVFDNAERCISEIRGALEASRLSKEGN